ncbi:hypothetical protein EJ110_NYTH27546 [Nymphaea thermarum]|nr:hypothetical protein EJ110_NYTH27546 [Nymphaea thermarum]
MPKDSYHPIHKLIMQLDIIIKRSGYRYFSGFSCQTQPSLWTSPSASLRGKKTLHPQEEINGKDNDEKRAQEGTGAIDIVGETEAGLGGPLAYQGHPSMVEPGLRGDSMEMAGPEESAKGREVLLPSPAPNNGKSWASIVDRGRLEANMDMPPLEKKEMEAKRRLIISQQSYEVLCQPFRFSAIATLVGDTGKGRLDYNFIFASLKSLGPGVADLRFTSVRKDMFLLRTSSEADLSLILSPIRWYVGGRLLIANQWHPSMPMRIESSNRVRIWIRLPDLPVEWWNPRIFTDIADLIGGSFVEADDYTRHLQRFGFARIKIEIPLGFSPISEIELEISRGKVFVQSIEYETKVKYCKKCRSTAHFDGSCTSRVTPMEGEKAIPNGWQTVKTPRRRPYNKEKETPTKQNKFQVLVHLNETIADGESSAKQPDERAKPWRRLPWSNGVRHVDRWVEISIASWFKDGRREVVGLIRDASGGFRFGLACWFENNTGWQETKVLMKCIEHLTNIDENLGRIYILANDGDWKRHLHNCIDRRTYLSYNFFISNSYLHRLSICKGWPLAETTHLLTIIPKSESSGHNPSDSSRQQSTTLKLHSIDAPVEREANLCLPTYLKLAAADEIHESIFDRLSTFQPVTLNSLKELSRSRPRQQHSSMSLKAPDQYLRLLLTSFTMYKVLSN